jgi:hypothetical protein
LFSIPGAFFGPAIEDKMSHSQAARGKEGRPRAGRDRLAGERVGRIVLIRDGRCLRPGRQRLRAADGAGPNLSNL